MPRRILALAAAAVIVVAGGCSEGKSVSGYCRAVGAGDNPLDLFARYDATNPAAATAALDAAVARLTQLRNAAPGEVRPSYDVLVQAARSVSGGLGARASDPTATVPDIAADAARINEASAKVVQYTAERCSVTLDPSLTTTTAPTAAPASS